MVFAAHKTLVWHWYCLIQGDATGKNQLAFLYLGSSLKWVQGIIKGQTTLDCDIKIDESWGSFQARNSIKYLL